MHFYTFSTPFLKTLLILLFCHNLSCQAIIQEDHENCKELKIPFCESMPYNKTIFPNIMDQSSQMMAQSELENFQFAVTSNCSTNVRYFLCIIYAPSCSQSGEAYPPCRSFCEQVRDDCMSLAKGMGFKWPKQLRCTKFPVKGTCIPINFAQGISDEGNDDIIRDRIQNNNKKNIYTNRKFKDNVEITPLNLAHILACPSEFIVENGDYEIVVSDIVIKKCGRQCTTLFSKKQENFAWYWVGIWSTLCVISSVFTLATFMLDTSRFKYPERPIVYLCGCYIFIGIAYVVGFAMGKRISCISPVDVDSIVSSDILVQGTKHESCTIIFMIAYYFSMASSIWWVILSFTWFLSAYMKWGHEAIEAHSRYFHLVAWTIPAIQTIAILALGKIEGDILSGTCFTGINDMYSKNAFVLIPLVIYLVIGTSFLIAGFISLVRIRSFVRGRGNSIDKLEKLIVRIGIFSVLYTVPATIVIACHFYTQQHHQKWDLYWILKMCKSNSLKNCPNINESSVSTPDFTIFMIQYLMMLIIGVTSSCWLWSNKTIKSWRFIYCAFGTKSKDFGA